MAARFRMFLAPLLLGACLAHAADWPPAVDPVRTGLEAKITLDRTTFVPNPEKPDERIFQKAHSESDLHISPQGAWSLTRYGDRPWDDVQVLQRGKPSTSFQTNPRPDMLIKTTGTLVTVGGSAFLPSEPLGWCDLSLGSPTPERTLRDALASFHITSVESREDSQTFHGKDASGATATVVTDRTGRQLRVLAFEHLAPGFRLTRRTEYRAWKTVGGHVVPTKGTCSFQLDQPAAGVREADVTSFTLTDLKPTAKPTPPPFEEGMLFREIGHGKPRAFRYQNGRYVPTKDPGNVFLRSTEPPDAPPYAALFGGTALLGAIAFGWRRRGMGGPPMGVTGGPPVKNR